MTRVRQAVIAARELEPVAQRLREELDLGEPFSDPAIAYFGLRNAVFALGDTFLEVVSPVRGAAAAARLLQRRGTDVCGYMVMFQVDDLAAARERARAAGVREVFEVALDDIDEVHLHPADMRGAIVSLSAPRPSESWRWGGPEWRERSAACQVAGVTIAVADHDAVADRWGHVIGGLPAVRFAQDPDEPGLVEIELEGATAGSVELGGVRIVSSR